MLPLGRYVPAWRNFAESTSSGSIRIRSRNAYGESQGTKKDPSQNDLRPEAKVSQSQSTQNVAHTTHMTRPVVHLCTYISVPVVILERIQLKSLVSLTQVKKKQLNSVPSRFVIYSFKNRQFYFVLSVLKLLVSAIVRDTTLKEKHAIRQ